MKALKAISLIAATIVSIVSLYFAWPRLARDFPMLNKLEATLKSIRGSSTASSGHQGNLAIYTKKPAQDLTPEQANWLEVKRRRHQLLSEAVAK